MIYNFKKIDANMFKSNMDGLGRETTNYYTNETDRILVEPNSNFDGGKIYCYKESWIKRGDIISISDNWYVVSQLSNLASDIFNVGVITLCDVFLTVQLGNFTYRIPAVASKYSGNSNVRGIIDDSAEGKLSFITGYSDKFEEIKGNPYVVMFGKMWQIGDYMNVNNVLTVYCEGATSTGLKAEIGMSPIETSYKVGDRIKPEFYLLNTTKTGEITLSTSNNTIAEVDSQGRIHFLRRGSVNIVATSNVDGAMYISPNITVK